MNENSSVPYPGTETEPDAVLLLANQYACAARLLFTEKSLKQALRMPAMFCAIHAIELYLNSAIIASGETPKTARQHASRFGPAQDVRMTRLVSIAACGRKHRITSGRGPAPSLSDKAETI